MKAFLIVVVLLVCHSAEGAILCRDGKALMPVIIAPDASDTVRQAAEDLVEYLGRIGQASFELQSTKGANGIALEVVADPQAPEHYTIRTRDQSLRIVGGSDLAVQHAVWDLLYRIGYRQYFPTAHWEIVPRHSEIKLDLNVDERPAYRSRNVWYGYGRDPWNEETYRQWVARNRMGGGFDLNTGHSWGRIVQRHKDLFDQHPEWLALVDGKRVAINGLEKFCISNEDLRKLVAADVVTQAKAEPTLDSISLDPTDGLGWCECDDCQAIGSPSDRLILLANQAATALEEAGFDRIHLGMYAYAGHAKAPRIQPHGKVVISVATAFSDQTPEETIAAWKASGVQQFGIREYHSVVAWDRNLPGSSRASNTEYLAETIPRFHELGARFYTSESGDCWGPCGLGHFLSARLLWDVSEAERVDQIVDRFVTDCFGEAAGPMKTFFDLIDGANRPLLSRDLIGRMYRLIGEAKQLTADASVQARLDDLAIYTRFVQHIYDYRQGSTEEGIAAIQLAWRARETGMVHTQALYRDIPHRDKLIIVPEQAAWGQPESTNPWKTSQPFEAAEIASIIAQGIADNPLFDFTPQQFGGPIRPAELERGFAELGDFGPRDRHEQFWLIWNKQPSDVVFEAVTGEIPSYRKVRETRFQLETVGQPIDGVVDSLLVKPDGESHAIRLQSKFAGLHRLTSADAGAMTSLTFPP